MKFKHDDVIEEHHELLTKLTKYEEREKIMETRIITVALHIAQNFGGTVTSNPHSEKHSLNIKLIDTGVHITGKGSNKFIPFSNIQGIDFMSEDGNKTVASDRSRQ